MIVIIIETEKLDDNMNIIANYRQIRTQNSYNFMSYLQITTNTTKNGKQSPDAKKSMLTPNVAVY